jgi:hypothetical protein
VTEAVNCVSSPSRTKRDRSRQNALMHRSVDKVGLQTLAKIGKIGQRGCRSLFACQPVFALFFWGRKSPIENAVRSLVPTRVPLPTVIN